jgi:serine/threonine protein kinase
MFRSLYKNLDKSKRMCPLTNNWYIPLDTLQDKITWPAFQESLPNCNLENKIQRARKVIAIIVLIYPADTRGNIESVLSDQLTDEDLPLSRPEELTDGQKLQSQCRNKIFTSFMAWDSDDVELFLEKQWMVLEPQLKFHPSGTNDIPLESQCTLEIAFCSCDEVCKTEHSTVYKCALRSGGQNGFGNSVSSLRLPPDISAKANINLQAKAENSGPVCVALKKFDARQVKQFTQEKQVLNDICSKGIKSDHLITHLVVCDQVSCIIFPWADGGDLAELWQQKSSVVPNVFMWSLRQIVGLTQALEVLHSVNTRHGDLKPANILYFGGNDGGTLKIADLGIARGHTQATEFRRVGTVTSASTAAYQAPEMDKKEEEPMSRRYDCWSMGCIVLEFIVWLLYDFEAIKSFSHARDTRTHAYYRFTYVYIQGAERLEKVDVHPVVIDAMNFLRKKDPRCTGTALEDLVNLVDQNMLKIEPSERLHAIDIHERLQWILKKAEKEPSYLVKVDEHPPTTPLIFDQPPLYTIPETTIEQKRLSLES